MTGQLAATASTGPVRPVLIGGRYEVVARLGKGAMGAVYRVRDATSGDELALKRLLVDGSERRRNAALLRFRREFHTMSGLRHPRIVDVQDFGTDGTDAWYTMELLDGDDLAQLGDVSPERACLLLRDVASALAFLHSRRLIHRDVAPRNVRCTADGRAKLIDFGVIATPGIVREVAGTPPCIAPEGPRGQPLDHRADLFGLGALLYYVLTGRHAYFARSLAELEEAWRKRPAPPSSMRDDVPEALDALVMSLLALDPMARPASAAEVMDRLGGIAGVPVEPEMEVARGYLVTSSLVGRQKEMRLVRGWLDRVANGRGGAVTIEAQSGTGKSRLLREVGVEAQLAGAAVVFAESEGKGRGPYAVMRTVAAGLLAARPQEAADAAQPRAAILGRVLPPVRARFPDVPLARASEDPHEDRMLLQSEIARWILDTTRRQPIAVLVDDIQRCDEASAAVLAAIAHGARNHRLLVVCASRTDEPARAEAAIASLRDAGDHVRLRGLDAREVGELVRALFGDVPNAERLADFMHSAAGGSPLRCTALAHYLVESGAVRYSEGMWLLPDTLEGIDTPSSLADAMDARIRALAPHTRALGEALAIRGGDLPLELCVALADEKDPGGVRAEGAGGPRITTKDEHEVFRALDELVYEEILIGDPARYAFRHDGLREALLRNMTEERERELHRRAGDVLSAIDIEAHEGEIGWHLLRGGEERRGAELLERAGRKLYASQSFSDALPPLEAALAVYERAGCPERLRLDLRQMLTRAGVICDREVILRYADDTIEALRRWSGMGVASKLRPKLGRFLSVVIGVLWAAIRWPFLPSRKRGPGPRAAVTQLVALVNYAASVYSLGFDIVRGRITADILEPLAFLRTRLPGASYLLAESFLWMALGHWQKVYRHVDEALYALENDRLTPLSDLDRNLGRGGALYMRASIDAMQMDPRYAETLEKLERLDLRFFDASTRMARVFFHRMRGEEELAKRAQAEGEMMSVQLGSAWVFDAQMQWLSAVGYALSRDVLGLKRAVAGLERLLAQGHRVTHLLNVARADYHRERGDLELALKALDEADSFAREDETFVRQLALAARAETHLAENALEKARAAALEGIRLGDDRDVGLLAERTRCARVLALVEAAEGDHEAAARRLEHEITRARTSGSPTMLGSLHEARARVALAMQDLVAFEHHRLECDAWFRSTANPVLIARAEWLVETGQAARGSHPPDAMLRDDAVTMIQRSDPASRASRLLSGCRGKHERAHKALEMLLTETNAASGYLFLRHEDGLELVAPVHGQEPPEALVSALEACVSLNASEVTVPDVQIRVGEDDYVLRWHPAVLATERGSDEMIAGAVALIEGADPYRPPAEALTRTLARALFDAGDVTSHEIRSR